MFFFKQKTAYELRISDWSSDVCSSDLLVSEQLAAAAHAALDLVEHQQQAVLVADGTQGAQIVEVGGADAALALNRLDQHRAGFGANRVAQLVHVAEGHEVEAFGDRAGALQVLLVAGCREGGKDRKSTRLNSSH